MEDLEVKSYKKLSVEGTNPKNAVIYVLDPIYKDVSAYITDKNGKPRPLKTADIDISNYVKDGDSNSVIIDNDKIFVKKYVGGDGIQVVERSDDYLIRFTGESGKFEVRSNKQDNLSPDGTGEKYPTVDAVNEVIAEVRQEISNTTSDKTFVYEQTTPSDTWEYQHGLNKKPSVVATDSAGTVISGQIVINDGYSVKILFNMPFWGYAINN